MTLFDGIYGVYRDHVWIFWSGFGPIVLGCAWLMALAGIRIAGRNVLPLDPPRRRRTDRVLTDAQAREIFDAIHGMTSRRVQ